jgi:hypothetical protein
MGRERIRAVTKPLQEDLREMLNRPVRWRTVLFSAWFAYCIWGIEWEKLDPGWGICAGAIVADRPANGVPGLAAR